MELYGREISQREREGGGGRHWRGNDISFFPPTGFQATKRKEKKN
jgi:hypothetical protein